MRFNFKKVASVLASIAMLGSTVGFAAAANYPAPFVAGSTSDVAIVVGATAAGSDYFAALDIAVNLQAALPSSATTSSASASGGDSVQIAKATNKLNLNNHIADVWSTKITDTDMPNLLKDGTFRSKDNVDYAYEQYLEFAPSAVSDINFTQFDDDDYKTDTPTLGVKISSNTKLLNYTLDFKKYPRSDVNSAGRLEDLEDRDITLLGKTYKLLNAYNKSSDTKLELMRGAVTSTINLNEEKTLSVEAVGSYTVTLTFVDSTYTQFDITDSKGNKQTTTKLAKGGTYKLADGTQLGVTDISYQSFSGGVMSAEFTLGASKLTLENGQNLEVDDIDENDITVIITRSEPDSNKVDLQKVILEWAPSDEKFITPDSEVLIPALNSIKLSASAPTIPCEEKVTIKSQGTKGIEMTVPIKDGDAKLNILYGNGTDFNYVAGDSDGTKVLRTGENYSGSWIQYDKDTDNGFVASWNSTTDSESYFMKVTSVTEDSGIHENYTTIENRITGNSYSNKKANDIITIGNVELTIVVIDKDAKSVNMSINNGGTFNRIYTKGGLGIWLPLNLTDGNVMPVDTDDYGFEWGGLTNLTDGTGGADFSTNTQWMLMMTEEDKDGNLGSGAVLNVTLGWSSSEAQPTEVQPDSLNAAQAGKQWSAGTYKEIGDTNVYEGYITSDLGTKVLYTKPTSGTKSVEIIYHCSQMYGNVFITAPETTVSGGGTTTGGSQLGSVTVKDSEVSKVSDKNLIVVGGSCVNSVASKLLDGAGCGASFTAKAGVAADQFLIKVFTSPYKAEKVAMLVAGYEAADTTKAVKYLTTNTVASATGTTVKKVTSTLVDVA